MREIVDYLLTTLNGAMTNVATSLTLTAVPSGTTPGKLIDILIDPGTGSAEWIQVTVPASGSTFSTITRALYGTTAVAHSNGATVRVGGLTSGFFIELKKDADLVDTGVKTGAYNALHGDRVLCNASSSFSVTLPSAPLTGTRIGVKLTALTSTNVITVDLNGKTADGSSTNPTLSAIGDYIALEYSGTEWHIIVQYNAVKSVSQGGTGAVTFVSNGVLYGNATGAVQALAVNATATNMYLTQTSSGIPAWATIQSADVPTLNQNTTGSAATLTTTRSIYGNNFNGSAALAQIIASTFGGTGNGFAKLSGPTTAEKTFTLPDASATILTSNAAVTVAQGGTGVATLASNGVLYGNGTGVVLALAVNSTATNKYLTQVSSGAPAWNTIAGADVPTLNQNTTGSAATLTTTRSIYGNNFNGSAALAQIIASTFGGTGNGFAKLSGPTTAEKTFTLPDASATILTSNAAVTVAQGGTGVATLAANGVVYGNDASAVGVTAVGATGQILIGTTSSAPSWSATPTLTTSLTCPTIIGGTGTADSLTLNATSNGSATTNSDVILKSNTEIARLRHNGDFTVLKSMTLGSNTLSTLNNTAGDLTATRLCLGNSAAMTTQTVLVTGSVTEFAGGAQSFFQITSTIVPSQASTSSYRALNFSNTFNSSFNINTGGSTFPTGAYYENRVTNAANINGLIGVQIIGMIMNSGAQTFTGSATIVRGLQIQTVTSFSNSGAAGITGSIATAAGIYIQDSALSSTNVTIAAQCGICIDALSVATKNTALLIGTATVSTVANYAIYSTNTNTSTLSGKLGVSMGTTPATPTADLGFDGNSARTIAPERHTTTNTTGNNLTITAGSAKLSATNTSGGNLILQSGISTGSGTSSVLVQVPGAGGTSTADGTQTTLVTYALAGIHTQCGTYEDITADVDGSTITFNLATTNMHKVTLGGNRTLALSGAQIGQKFQLRLTQDGTGSRTVTWFTTIKWDGGSAPTLTTTINKTDWFAFVCTGVGTYDGFVMGKGL